MVLFVVGAHAEKDMDCVVPLFFFGSVEANQHGGCVLIEDCKGKAGLEQAYRTNIRNHQLSGPTTFVPLIHEAIRRVKQTKKYHLLLIITDGAVTVSQ
jgi:hypothetical protein